MTIPGHESHRNFSIEEKVSFLSSPQAYGARTGEIEIRETHMSWLFLVGRRVYKFKKPVRYPYLDFRTLAARKTNCLEEVRLNRRLAPDVYLGISRLTVNEAGVLALDGKGRTVEWLVVMRRLPEEWLLHNAVIRGSVSQTEAGAVGDVLSRFYAEQKPVEVSAAEQLELFFRQQQTNRHMLGEPRFKLSNGVLDRVLADIDHVLEHEPELITSRVEENRIVEGHGDLRPEHVCLCDPPVVIDCLEFSRVLRLLDPFDELADLALECERLGAAWVGETIIDRCAAALNDHPSKRLMAFYTTYRACLRARLAVRHLLDSNVRQPGKWLPLARDYLAIADRARLSLQPPASPRATRSHGNDE